MPRKPSSRLDLRVLLILKTKMRLVSSKYFALQSLTTLIVVKRGKKPAKQLPWLGNEDDLRLDYYFLKQIDVFGKKLQTSLEKIITYGAIDKPNFRPERNSSLRTPAKNKQHYPPLTAVGRYRKLNHTDGSRLSK